MMNFSVDPIILESNGKCLGLVNSPIYSCAHFQVNENEMVLRIKNIASFHVRFGREVLCCPDDKVDKALVNLFLNGSVLGAMLHQRGIFPFHGSSFQHEGLGVMICGTSGTGKSSLTVAFCQNGSRFITDDITPVRIEESGTIILPVKTSIKLWEETLQNLAIEYKGLERIRPELDKFYLPMAETAPEEQRLDHLFILGMHNQEGYEIKELTGMDKYNALRGQIYRRVYLKGMPETEKKYFKQLFQLAAKVRVTQVVRPRICDIYDTMDCISKELLK